ncbi:MAG: hypothetical protein WDN00_06840 [Limisphaerales bacterium]
MARAGKFRSSGLLKRAGKVFVQIVPNCSKTEPFKSRSRSGQRRDDHHTHGWKAYDGLVLDGFKHQRVHHHENEFARGKRHINRNRVVLRLRQNAAGKQRGVWADKFSAAPQVI